MTLKYGFVQIVDWYLLMTMTLCLKSAKCTTHMPRCFHPQYMTMWSLFKHQNMQSVGLLLFSLSSYSGMLSVNGDDMFVLHFYIPTVLLAVVLLTIHTVIFT